MVPYLPDRRPIQSDPLPLKVDALLNTLGRRDLRLLPPCPRRR